MKTLIKPLLIAIALLSSVATFSEAKPIGRTAKKAAAYEVGMYTAVDGSLMVALDKQQGGSVTVSIKNTSGTTLFTQYVGKRTTQSRLKLNLNELADGTYTVVVSNGVDTKTQELTIETRKAAETNRQIALN